MLTLFGLFLIAVGAGALGGVVGTGSSLILLPILVMADGPRTAVPVMAIASIAGNVAKVAAWRNVIQWRPVLVYAIPGTPAAVFGAHTLMTVPPRLVDGLLVVFFLAMIPLRRLAAARQWRVRLWQMAFAGAAVGFLTGLILSTGPMSVPIFTGYGLSGGAFLGSEAAAAVVLYIGKTATFGEMNALDATMIVHGLVIGTAMAIGPFMVRGLVRRANPRTYALLIDAVLVAAACGMLVSAVTY
ncbi:sulfite exporter TauE/SafE family protein [Mycobacterium hackensackense]|nr:sulfite exporter TauE/SafE family protein [Mycobacterium hackensackense]